MDRHAWKPFLQRWSEEWRIAHPGEEPDGDPWLGCPPATEDEVQALEARLGCVLPPSFREFLLVTNGWRHAGNFVWSLRGTEEIGWLTDLEPMWAETWVDREVKYEDPAAARSLLISLRADAGVVYLDPGDVDERGEWAAYDVFSWRARGPERHGSFHEKMYHFYAEFHALDRPRCETQREWDATVEDARLASLRGEVDRPLAVFAQAARFGRDRASFLLFQMRTLLRSEDGGLFYPRPTKSDDTGSWTLDEDLFAAQVLPLLSPLVSRPAGSAPIRCPARDKTADHSGSNTSSQATAGRSGSRGPSAVIKHGGRSRRSGSASAIRSSTRPRMPLSTPVKTPGRACSTPSSTGGHCMRTTSRPSPCSPTLGPRG
ncbi:SMI1/KNR4 family protein [Microbispora rosea]|uniref:SMI1/KNR4 family protein n=1 Tax=Microbispora rosea TaxID=58117 RepID=UPI0004C2C357|nr:SMI1/KNR4 family protein [Microbispora rosea]